MTEQQAAVAPDFAALREAFPVTRSWTYLDLANKAPLPRCAQDAIPDFLQEMNRFADWFARFPRIRSVIVHGWPTATFDDGSGSIRWPGVVARIQEDFPVFSEVLYPIAWGRDHPYPYAAAMHHVRQFHDRFGASRMIWGSDMPNVERYCTYRQSLDYVLLNSGFLTETERTAVFGGNCLSLFRPDDGR